MNLKRLTALSAFILVGACSDSTGPGDVDPSVLAQGVTSLSDVFATNAAFNSVTSLQFLFPQYVRANALAALRPLAVLQRLGDLPPTASLRRPPALLLEPNDVQALFPSDVLGKTLEWDVATDQYVIGAATGAPANGIRIRLYLVDPSQGLPFEPLNQIGYLDLTDKSSPQADRLGVLIRLFTTTVAEYDVTSVVTTTSQSLQAVGYLKSADALRTADFDLGFIDRPQAAEQVTDYYVEGDDGTYIRLLTDGGTSSSSLDFRVGRGESDIALLGDELNGTVDGVIQYNGTTVATITGPAEDPVIAGANGHELTNAELAALGEIFGTALLLLLVLSLGIFGPAGVVFGA